VRNTGGAGGHFEAELTLDGEITGRETPRSRGRGTGSVRFALAAGEAGDHVLPARDARSTLRVLGPAEFELTSLAVEPNPAETGDRLDVHWASPTSGGSRGPTSCAC